MWLAWLKGLVSIALVFPTSAPNVFAQTKATSSEAISSPHSLSPAEKNGRWGYTNGAGAFVIEPKYFAAHPFKEGYALVVTRRPFMPFGSEYGEFSLAQVTWVNTAGRKIPDPLSVRTAGDFSDGLALVVPDSVLRTTKGCAKGGYVDTHGAWAIKPQFDGVSDFSEGLAAVNRGADCGMGGKWGYIDKTGRVIIPFRFEFAGQFKNRHARVKESGKWETIDSKGDVSPVE